VELIGELVAWRVALRSGSLLEIWAHGYSERGGVYVFEVLVEGGGEAGKDLLVIDSKPDSAQMVIAVARLHSSEVDSVRAA
jgi:hypothetical protein